MQNLSNFIIVIDDREKTPWDFVGLTKKVNCEDISVTVMKMDRRLKTGDYTIFGAEEAITIERKSALDLIGTLTRGKEKNPRRARFVEELERMQRMDFSAVVVEAEWREVIQICYTETNMNPVSLDSSILAFMQRYIKTHWIFRPHRFAAMKTTYKILDRYHRDHMIGKVNGK